MEALIGLLFFLGVVALWAVISGIVMILKRCALEPLAEVLVEKLRETRAGAAWPWWI